MKILKYISGRYWGVEARTLRYKYIVLIQPILEYGAQVYQVASASNLDKRSASRVITGHLNSCPKGIVLYEAYFQPLRLLRKYLLAKYFAKLISYGDQHRTSRYVRNWHNNSRLER
ncbi:RNase H domain-containing protein [Trichonephila inaurata madagascariensis]|uniref:RNase H domain-containing protein n=2 Tax=Trichonephila inaurata madagascariensis TaxID=2747483 RepID=A0A8X7CE67_9ARAC|nr:RNase H domain-containing protein [Trichonephila inaurata madagascariensis]